MQDVLDDEGRWPGPVPLFGMAVAALMSAAIVHNAFFMQDPAGVRARLEPSRAGTGEPSAEVTVRAAGLKSDTNTVILRYDPLVEQVQRELRDAGLYRGDVDGVAGRRTREAVRTYQQNAGLAPSGSIDRDLLEHMLYARRLAEAAAYTSSTDGDAAAEIEARIRRVQAELVDLGYAPGPVDGHLTAATREAIRRFAADRGIDSDGSIDDALLAELARAGSQSGLAAGQ